ncbi:hypothetical protein Vretimale_15284 [Volvox reticuliferus]|uniref:Impact N-terminal domain-containing protein n=1 Tax=Volvox reticuliferus TaxID=1737510 RepID=A0A8J4CBC5_9CHLO|nr:hypothetical protein Vretifemale_5482 [Volvox reticuliferus]GIM11822.1 hypothetical protein Vretimale_15284 [Volvox reticuliferus]
MSQLLISCSRMHAYNVTLLRHRIKSGRTIAAAPPLLRLSPPSSLSRIVVAAATQHNCTGSFVARPTELLGARTLSSAGTSSCRSSRGGSSYRKSNHKPMRSAAMQSVGAAASSNVSAAEGFWTLQSYVLYEDEIKKSKFVVHAWPVSSSAEAFALIRSASDPSASHNCFAFRVGSEFRASDDGEPGGSAGRPIQAAINGEGLDRVAVLVTRYFGGVKLGAGGLARAYGGVAKHCLRLAPRVFIKAQLEVVIDITYDELGFIHSCLGMHGCTRLAEEYGSNGIVEIRVLVDEDRLESLKAAVTDGTAGRRHVERADATTTGGSIPAPLLEND